MLFNSFNFFLFFVVLAFLYYAIPHKYRWVLLLAASCFFYCFFIPVYILVIGATILIDYFLAIRIESGEGRKRKLMLWLSIAANLSILGFFKYYNFVNENLGLLIYGKQYAGLLPYLHLALPIGLSFHTFQAMSYTIDIYRGQQKAEKHLGVYATFIMFFPQLVAGPIERAGQMLYQFYEEHRFNYENALYGLQRILWGLYKKVVVADTLAIYVNSVYGNYEHNKGLTLVVATYAFAFQIYCDFSGYSDIALGTAKVLGFDLVENFNLPYFAGSITEFWHRWHISLSRWLRDYLYIPLGGNRKSTLVRYRNILITMLLGGLWHGASWTFVIWGAINGVYLVVEKMLSSFKLKLWKPARVFIVFNLVSFAWIFFRADSLTQACGIVQNIFASNSFFTLHMQDAEVFVSMLVKMALLLIVEFFLLRKGTLAFSRFKRPLVWSLAFSAFIILFVVLFGVKEGSQFIYFQF